MKAEPEDGEIKHWIPNTYCSVCELPQWYAVGSGNTCDNGHGGAPSIDTSELLCPPSTPRLIDVGYVEHLLSAHVDENEEDEDFPPRVGAPFIRSTSNEVWNQHVEHVFVGKPDIFAALAAALLGKMPDQIIKRERDRVIQLIEIYKEATK